MSQSQSYSLTVQTIAELSWTSSVYSKFRAKFKPDLFVEVFVDDVPVARTKVVKDSLKPVWGDILTIPSATESSIIVLKLKHSSTMNSYFGFVKTSVGDLLRLCKKSEVTKLGMERRPKKALRDAQGLISVGIKAVNVDQARHNLLETARQDIERGDLAHADVTLPTPQGLENVGAAVSENKDLLQSLGTVLNKIQVIADATVNAVDVLAKVHPYADTAWKVLSSVYKAYQHQKETDANVVALFDKMAALYSFVDDVEEGLLSKITRLERTIVRVLEKTTECGKFFREYTEVRFTARFVGQMTSNQSQMVSDLSVSLGQLQEELISGVMLQTAVESSQTRKVVVQTYEVVEKFVKSDSLKALEPASMDTAIKVSCLAGTREDLLKDIIDWLITPSEGHNALWLHGAAGLGKSTLANSIAEHFRGHRQQGAFLFFDRNTPLESNPARVIRTLAYQLAEHDQAIKTAISLAMEKDPQLTSAPLSTQFTSLLMNPLSTASQGITGPVIIVLDALDECGDAESRRALLSLLSHELAKFPRQFRFLITSRPDSDIERAFKSAVHIHAIDLSMSESSTDVLLYIKHEMAQIYSIRHSYDELPPDWAGPLVVQRLASFAAGLFIWAATAMKFLRLTEDPVRWLSKLLAQEGQAFTLDELYKTALRSASQWEPGETTDAFRQVLGLIVIGQIPLTDATISELLGFEDSGRQCRIALRRLGCVIQWSEGQPARTFHKSFPDYLTDRSRCSSEPWFIDKQEHHRALTIRSFRLMKSQLRFNICNLTDSHILNKDVPDLPARIQSSIPESLWYACRFWMDHLGPRPTGDSDNDMQCLILEFFEHRFFYWLEVLSLLEQVPLAVKALIRVKAYAMDPKSELHAFAQDGISFLGTFAGVVTKSVPHIYLSCIPFAPRSSILKQRYSSVVQKTLVVQIGLQEKWPPCQQVIVVNRNLVLSVAFSPDGQRIASGSADNSICIWDAESGALRAGPFAGHTDWVNSVVFSPDGQRIASGSDDETIRVWDAESGALKAGPFTGHTDWVRSVVFSPDGHASRRAQMTGPSVFGMRNLVHSRRGHSQGTLTRSDQWYSRQTDIALCRDPLTRPSAFGMRSLVHSGRGHSKGTLTGSCQWCSRQTDSTSRRALGTIPSAFGMRNPVHLRRGHSQGTQGVSTQWCSRQTDSASRQDPLTRPSASGMWNPVHSRRGHSQGTLGRSTQWCSRQTGSASCRARMIRSSAFGVYKLPLLSPKGLPQMDFDMIPDWIKIVGCSTPPRAGCFGSRTHTGLGFGGLIIPLSSLSSQRNWI
ncbi:hypothetical protein FIBSPDRAFT_216561 [Athelia psychrophila]|uniref:WD40 repeat-like protein n=1 Tax=Athelia psychrophila TaxID=1759441 RepID=A0A166SFB9_9AGAM|nr:hypothetical protein FIBSPDRAFT_216561 [Fibularhizoctonia sp. CBS 109695]